MGMHGGDIYRNHVKIDFSTNVNPLGVPKTVVEAMHKAVERCGSYPDIEAEKLRESIGSLLSVPKEDLLFGNGASELFLAIVHAILPKKIMLPIPSFFGYEYAARSVESEIVYYETKQENHFCITKDLCADLTEEIDLLFLANPNNPTGRLLERETLRALLWHCEKKGIYVVLDECFVEFCGNDVSMLSALSEFPHLLLVRAFTKIFAIPGIRLGYFLCEDRLMRAKIAAQLAEWNISCVAQEAGCACAKQVKFIAETREYVRKERQFLEEGLRQKGFFVIPSQANFILFYSETPLYEKLLGQGILIRDCQNFKGLGQGFYRIAVKGRAENEILLESL